MQSSGLFFTRFFARWKNLRPMKIKNHSSMEITASLKCSLCLLFAGVVASPLVGAEKQLKAVGLPVADLSNPFFVQIAHGVEDQAKQYNPKVKITALSSGSYDVGNQTNQMDNLISAGVDMIILGAADSKGIAPAVTRAKAAGIVVIAVDVSAEGGVDATVMSDNKQAGKEAGQYIADKLKGKGQMVIVNGPPISSVQDRVAGALEVLKKYPDIKILSQDQNAGGSRDGGLRVMTDLLTAFPKLDAVFAINDRHWLRSRRKAGATKRVLHRGS
jgi:ribose transport system substrate-binding protein